MCFKKSNDFLKLKTFGIIVIFYETEPLFLGLSGMQHVLSVIVKKGQSPFKCKHGQFNCALKSK